MQKKRLLSFLILGLLASVIVVQFVGVVSADDVTDWIKNNLITPLGSGSGYGEGFSRFLFGVVIALLVYAVTDKLPGMKEEKLTWARWVIAGIIAYFGTVFLSGTELLVLISSYSALGFTLGIILPFSILIFFSYDLWESPNIKNVWIKVMLMRVIWAVFTGFLVVRIITGGPVVSKTAIYAMWAMVVFSIVIFVFTKYIGLKIIKEKDVTTILEAGRTSKLAARREKQLAESIYDVSGMD